MLFNLSGCKVGPPSLPPAPPPIQPQFQQGNGRSQDTNDGLMTWWLNFNDPQLTQLIEEANLGSLTLKEAFFRVAEARARVGVARGDWFPQVTAKSGSTYRQSSANALQSTTGAGGAYDFYEMGFDTAWEIDLFGRIARNVEAACEDFEAEKESLHDVQVTLLADVASTYLAIRQLQQRLQIAQRNLELQERTLNIVRTRQEAGVVGQLDEAEAESNVHLTNASIPPIQQELQAALNRLSVLLGRVPDIEFRLQEGYGEFPQPNVTMLHTGLPGQLLERRPDIRRAEHRVLAANARIGAAIADRLPQLTIRGDISVEARHLDILYSGGSLAHSVGPGFRWNVLNFGRLKSQVKAREAAHSVAVINYQSTVLNAVREVETSLFDYDRQLKRAEILTHAIEATRRASDVSQIRYEQNLVPFLRVLDAQRNLATAEGNLAATRGDALISLVKLYKALGGGWERHAYAERAACGQDVAVPADAVQLPIDPRVNAMPVTSQPLSTHVNAPESAAPEGYLQGGFPQEMAGPGWGAPGSMYPEAMGTYDPMQPVPVLPLGTQLRGTQMFAPPMYFQQPYQPLPDQAAPMPTGYGATGPGAFGPVTTAPASTGGLPPPKDLSGNKPVRLPPVMPPPVAGGVQPGGVSAGGVSP